MYAARHGLLGLRMELQFAEKYSAEVVGIQYSSGILSDKECVMFRRNPANRYDRNAIQVPGTQAAL